MSTQLEHTLTKTIMSTATPNETFVAAVIMASIVCIFLFLHLQSKSQPDDAPTTPGARIFLPGSSQPDPIPDIEAIPVVTISIGLDDNCTICLTELSEGDDARLLPNCSHGFHQQCINSWLVSSGNNTCPLCRSPVCDEVVTGPADTHVVVEIPPMDEEEDEARFVELLNSI